MYIFRPGPLCFAARVLHRSKANRGAAYIEFIFSGLIIAMLFVGGVEFGSYLRTKIRMTSVMREISSEMYRECFGLAPDPICLRDVAERIGASNQNLLPGLGIISSFYICTAVNLITPPSATWRARSTLASSRHSRLDGHFPPSLQPICVAHAQGIIVSEGFVTYSPLLPSLWQWIGIGNLSTELYAATLF